jgi:class 3 adenylate cyclase
MTVSGWRDSLSESLGLTIMSGTKIPDPTGRPPDRRKLVAIVYADMVGYSRLIGLDDAGTLQRLRSLRSDVIDPAIEEHGGRIVQTGGDSLLIVFDSIDGAVRCAVQVQQLVPTHDLPISAAVLPLYRSDRVGGSATSSRRWFTTVTPTVGR